jgi:hypothetical protein
MHCPGSRQGGNQQNGNAKHTYFAGRFDGHHGAPVRHRKYHLMEKVRGWLSKKVGEVQLAIYCYINRCLLRVFTNNLLKYLSIWTLKNS